LRYEDGSKSAASWRRRPFDTRSPAASPSLRPTCGGFIANRPALALDPGCNRRRSRRRQPRLPLRPAAAPDGLDGTEGTFSICSFWYVDALPRACRIAEARLVFEKMLTYANHLGLYSEQIGATGELHEPSFLAGYGRRGISRQLR